MQTYQSLIAELKHSPQLPVAIEELNAYWQAEQQKRLQFYSDLDEDTKAEFIDGEVIVHSPAREIHNLVVMQLTTLCNAYVSMNRLGVVRCEKALIELTRNAFEPDVVFFSTEKANRFTDETFYYPAPDWVCEVLSPSTEKYDRRQKLLDYALHGVEEYWIIDPDKKVVEQYLLDKNKDCELAFKAGNGIVTFKAIKGLKLPVAALFDQQLHLEALQEILIKK